MNEPRAPIDIAPRPPGDHGGLLTLDEAHRRVAALITPVAPVERAPLWSALGRVLAEDVRSAVDVPPFANSAVDGYAIRSADASGDSAGGPLGSTALGQVDLRVVGASQAGAPFDRQVVAGTCVRILTGAVVPPGADTVVMQEDVTREGDVARVPRGVEAGEHVRAAGQDVRRGDRVAAAGDRITPAHLGALASVGLADVAVYRRPRVAFFSTGDELRVPGEALGPGQIYDSNRLAVFGMLTRIGADTLDFGIVPDRADAVRGVLADAAASADALVTTGGVSVGDTDHVKAALEAMGRVAFWRIAIKPGKPLAVGTVGSAVFFGLPGNPVSAMVTFYQVVQPALRRLAGETDVAPRLVRARLTEPIDKHPGRLELQRGVLSSGPEGRLDVRSTGMQGSHVLGSMVRANCFIVLPLESAGAAAGDDVLVQPFDGLV